MLFTGFPKVKIASLPMQEKLPVLVIVLVTFLLPIIISCAIYIKLIFIKQKTFLNKISPDSNICFSKTSEHNSFNYKLADDDNEIQEQRTKNRRETDASKDIKFSQQMVKAVVEIHNVNDLDNTIARETIIKVEHFKTTEDTSTEVVSGITNNALTRNGNSCNDLYLEKISYHTNENDKTPLEIQNPVTDSDNTRSEAGQGLGNQSNLVSILRESESQCSSVSGIDNIERKGVEDKIRAQLSASQRSLKTNLILLTIFVIIAGSDMIYPTIYAYVAASLLKAAVPILTTVANFGTI
jgi:hypothetical protein